jgi:hypothetical protein
MRFLGILLTLDAAMLCSTARALPERSRVRAHPVSSRRDARPSPSLQLPLERERHLSMVYLP